MIRLVKISGTNKFPCTPRSVPSGMEGCRWVSCKRLAWNYMVLRENHSHHLGINMELRESKARAARQKPTMRHKKIGVKHKTLILAHPGTQLSVVGRSRQSRHKANKNEDRHLESNRLSSKWWTTTMSTTKFCPHPQEKARYTSKGMLWMCLLTLKKTTCLQNYRNQQPPLLSTKPIMGAAIPQFG